MAVSRLVEVLLVDTKNKCELEMVENLISNASVQLDSLNKLCRNFTGLSIFLRFFIDRHSSCDRLTFSPPKLTILDAKL